MLYGLVRERLNMGLLRAKQGDHPEAAVLYSEDPSRGWHIILLSYNGKYTWDLFVELMVEKCFTYHEIRVRIPVRDCVAYTEAFSLRYHSN